MSKSVLVIEIPNSCLNCKGGKLMDKALLLINMPKSCENCQLVDSDYGVCCGIDTYGMSMSEMMNYSCSDYIWNGERPDWCPLIDLPTRDQDGDRGVAYKIGEPLIEEFADRLIAFGYNDCIDEILEKANKVTDKEEKDDE